MAPTENTPADQLTSGGCDQCAREADDLAAVHRIYVQPEAWDTEGKVTKLEDVEHWCFSCRSQYPNDPAEI